MTDARVVNIFVAHPADTVEEFLALQRAVQSCQETLTYLKGGVTITIREWDRNVPAGLHLSGGQGQIDDYVEIRNCDLVVGLIKDRIGRTGSDGSSDTQKEIRAARDAWKASGKPNVMVYFATSVADPTDEFLPGQLKIRGEFKQELRADGLTKDYENAAQLERRLATELPQAIFRALGGVRLSHVDVVPVTDRSARCAGVSEYTSDVEVELSGYRLSSTGMLPESAALLYFGTNVTGFLHSKERLVDAACRCLEVPARGETPKYCPVFLASPNSVLIRDLPLAPDPRSSVRLSVSGIRLNANQLGAGSSLAGNPILGLMAFTYRAPDGSLKTASSASFTMTVISGNGIIPRVAASKLVNECATKGVLLVPLVSRRSSSRDLEFHVLSAALKVHPDQLSTKEQEEPRWVKHWPEAKIVLHSGVDFELSGATAVEVRCSPLPNSARVFCLRRLTAAHESNGNRTSLVLETQSASSCADYPIGSDALNLVHSSGGAIRAYFEVPYPEAPRMRWWVEESDWPKGAERVLDCPIVIATPRGTELGPSLTLSVNLSPIACTLTASSESRPRFVENPYSSSVSISEHLRLLDSGHVLWAM